LCQSCIRGDSFGFVPDAIYQPASDAVLCLRLRSLPRQLDTSWSKGRRRADCVLSRTGKHQECRECGSDMPKVKQRLGKVEGVPPASKLPEAVHLSQATTSSSNKCDRSLAELLKSIMNTFLLLRPLLSWAHFQVITGPRLAYWII